MDHSHLAAGTSGATDFAQGIPPNTSPLSQSVHQPQPAHFNEDLDANQPDSSTADGEGAGTDIHRSTSTISQSNTLLPSRGGTLKKKQSLRRGSSLKRSSSRKSQRAGSVRSLALGEKEKYADGHGEEMNSAFYTPVPTTGNPTEILANRFQAWRKILKDLITFYRDIQRSYEARSKSLLTVSNVINNTSLPPIFLTEGGIGDGTHVLRDYHKQSLAEANKAKVIEEDVIVQLTGLRSDLQQKIKEIKNLSGDFKNAVDKETEGTRKAVRGLQEALGLVDIEPSATSGKGDPFIVRMGVDRQVERQIDEENYLHRAFLNLENSGRELESIVVGEIQKSYNAYAGILKREADDAYDAVERLQRGPIAMAKDHEWDAFVDNNEHFVDPRLPVRRVENIHYPGKDHPAASEVRAGLLERKSKYLKSYTPGWYVLSPTHLHEFKSADRINAQTPIMSLYLPEQKLGSHSNADSSSHKFMLKGRQTGGLHRGHGWVFRAESYDTMLAWYEDFKSLTEKTGEERNAFVRRHARSMSGGSHKAGSISSEGALDEDEADQVPYSAATSQFDQTSTREEKLPERPQPGGRFPSDMNISRNLQVPLSPSSGTSSDDHEIIAAAGALPRSNFPPKEFGQYVQNENDRKRSSGAINQSIAPNVSHQETAYMPIAQKQEYNDMPVEQGQSSNTTAASFTNDNQPHSYSSAAPQDAGSVSRDAEYRNQSNQPRNISSDRSGDIAYGAHPSKHLDESYPTARRPSQLNRPDSNYGEWMTPVAAGAGASLIGATGTEGYRPHEQQIPISQPQEQLLPPSSSPTQDAINSSNLAAVPPANEITVDPTPSEIDAFGSAPRIGRQVGTTSPTSPSSFTSTLSTTPTETTVEPQATGSSQQRAVGGVMNGPGETRPGLPYHTSVQTISDLHVPGEYPRATGSGRTT